MPLPVLILFYVLWWVVGFPVVWIIATPVILTTSFWGKQGYWEEVRTRFGNATLFWKKWGFLILP